MEAETLGENLSDAHLLVETLAYSLDELEEETLGDTLRDAQALVKTLADTIAEKTA